MAVDTPALPLHLGLARPSPSRLQATWRVVFQFFVSKPLGALGSLLMLALVVAAIFAGPITVPNPAGGTLVRIPGLAPYAPDDLAGDEVLAPPGNGFLLGTDALGRDVFSRVLFGAQTSLEIGLASVILS